MRKLGGRAIRWLFRSGHRAALTRALGAPVSELRGTVIDVGGGPDSPLAGCWNPQTHRVRMDIQARFGPHAVGDAAALPVRSSSVHGVLASEVLEHVPDPMAVACEVHRVLKPGGVWLGSVPFLGQGLHADPFDYYRYTDTALKRILADFEVVEVVPHGNGLGASWRLIITKLRWWVAILNPLLRQLSRFDDPIQPEGYVFKATKALGPDREIRGPGL